MNDRRTRNRISLYFIIGLPLAIVAVSTWLWVQVIQGDIDLVGITGTSNKGALIQPPKAVAELNARLDGDRRPAWEGGDWSLLIPNAGSCGEACATTLYRTRQLHIALGRNADKLQRYLLTTEQAGDDALTQALRDKHPRLQTLRIEPGALTGLLGKDTALPEPFAAGTVYVVDPQGWIMMVFSQANTGKEMLEDVEFLIKNAPDNG